MLMSKTPDQYRVADYYGVWGISPVAGHAISQQIQAVVEGRLILEPKAAIPMTFQPGKGKTQLGVIQLAGVLSKGSWWGTSTIDVRRQLKSAVADPNISGVLLAIDSPGGAMHGTEELTREIRQAARSKPVFAHVDGMATSAAYWVAAAADRVYASSNTDWVGNVGSYMMMYDEAARFEKEGVRQVSLQTGPLKVFGSGLGISKEQEEYMQAVVNSAQAEFNAAVKRFRGLSDSKMEQVTTGRIYPAQEGKELGLIDGVQPLTKTLEQLASQK